MKRTFFLFFAIISLVGMLATSGCEIFKKEETGELNGHKYIDLGLPSGLMWATCNIGASNPEDYGNYYSWAEISTKDKYSNDEYKYYDPSWARFTKYNENDNLLTIEASDDAATVNWGTGWRIPTSSDFEELINNCKKKAATQNNVNGILLTGPNGNSIFLPAAGFKEGYNVSWDEYKCYYMSSTLRSGYPHFAYFFRYDSGVSEIRTEYRYYGLSVRPVCESDKE